MSETALADDLEYVDELEADITRIAGPAENDADNTNADKRELLQLARESRVGLNQALDFLSYTELDLLRNEDSFLDLEPLYREYCLNGGRHWLSPREALKELDEILFKYAARGRARRRVMAPLMKLLTHCAAEGVNVTAFLQHVVRPRLSLDYNWRKWPERHYEGFRLILETLIELRSREPFSREVLGDEHNRLSRDVVLVKYAGRPLSCLPMNELENDKLRREYVSAWSALALESSFSLYFIKTNILHFVYAMAGKISLQQTTMLIRNLPEIEEGFRQSFPNHLKTIDVRKMEMNLYDYDIARSIKVRKTQGFTTTDFVEELKSYVRVILALLKTRSGIFLAGYYARKLAAAKNPLLAGHLVRLIESLQDTGGKYVYLWHTRRLIQKVSSEREAYLQLIDQNDGLDPEYPRAGEIFADDGFIVEQNIPADELERFGLSEAEVLPFVPANYNWKNRGFRPNQLLPAYERKDTSFADALADLQNRMVTAEDTDLPKNSIQSLDGCNGALLEPVLKRIIPGYGSSFATHRTARTFQHLYTEPGSGLEPHLKETLHRRFHLKNQATENGGHSFLEGAERPRKIFQGLALDIAPSPMRFINQKAMQLAKSVREKKNEMLNLHDTTNQKEREKLKKAVEYLERAYHNLQTIMTGIEGASPILSLIGALVCGASGAEPGGSYHSSVLHRITAACRGKEWFESRMNYLKNDIAPDLFSLEQLSNLINTLETIKAELTGREQMRQEIERLKESDEELFLALGSLSVTRKKKLTVESLDAALTRLFELNKLNALRASWLQQIESEGKGGGEDACYRIYASCAPLDYYYGHMGGICLSGIPQAIRRPGFMVLRLVSENQKAVQGMAILYNTGKDSPYLHAFAINPLGSVLRRLSLKEQMKLYLQFRKILEDAARLFNKPVVLAGKGSWGILSNRGDFANLIISIEKRLGSPEVNDARGVRELYYKEEEFARGWKIINPDTPGTMVAERILEKL